MDDDQQVPGSGSAAQMSMTAMAPQYSYDRDRLEYELTVRQEPKQARMCGVGGKADRRPIDPPPIVQLRVIDPSANKNSSRRRASSPDSPTPGSPTPSAASTVRQRPSDSTDDEPINAGYAQSFLQNPYYFMFASLAKPDDDAELHWLKDGRTRCTTGSVVSSLYHLKDTEHGNEDAGFFVFPDLSVRTEGSYRLKLSLFEVVGNSVRHCKSIFSAAFYVYTAKKFPGMEESTPLSCSLADQGIKIRIRKDIRVRKRPIEALMHPIPIEDSDEDDDPENNDGTNNGRTSKRSRTYDPNDPRSGPWIPTRDADGNIPPPLPVVRHPLPAPRTNPPRPRNDPAPAGPSGVNPPPPPPPAEQDAQRAPGPAVQHGPSPYDRGAGYHPYEPQHASPYRVDPNGQHVPPPPPPSHQHPQHQPYPQHIPPPPPQYGPPPPQHVPPPPHTQGPPQSHMPPPQGYAPYPNSGWGAPPPQPQQPPIYDPYAPPHHHQPQHHPPPHTQYGPPPHMQHHGPPPRYDYPASMYPPPHQQQPMYGYYDQQPQYAAPPSGANLGPGQQQGPIPPQSQPQGAYGDYSYGRGGSPLPGSRGYHHPQGYAPPPVYPSQQSAPPPPPPRGYAPPYYGYSQPPQAEPWGTPGPPPQAGSSFAPPSGGSAGWNDAYGSTSAASGGSGSSTGMVGAGDRIQLAPLRTSHGGHHDHGGSGASPVLPLSIPPAPSSNSSAGAGGYPVIQLRSSSRSGYGSSSRERDEGSRDNDRGKRNPLSIGSIISDETE